MWALVRAAVDEPDAAIYLTAAFTGSRMGELLALRWRDIDFDGSAVRVQGSVSFGELTTPKSGKVRSVPMVPEVATALARLGQRKLFTSDDELVFPGEEGRYMDGSALRRRYKAARKRAGLRPLTFHAPMVCITGRRAVSGPQGASPAGRRPTPVPPLKGPGSGVSFH